MNLQDLVRNIVVVGALTLSSALVGCAAPEGSSDQEAGNVSSNDVQELDEVAVDGPSGRGGDVRLDGVSGTTGLGERNVGVQPDPWHGSNATSDGDPPKSFGVPPNPSDPSDPSAPKPN